jgi:predicted transcriptional regulator
VVFLVRSRRDDLEVCMEILEHLVSLDEPVSITELAFNVRVKHQKAKNLLDSMEKVNWITSSTSMREDLRFKDLYEILPEGLKVLKIYFENLENLFKQLQDN